MRDLRCKSAMCHPPGSPPPPSQGRTPRASGLRSRAPGRQRVVSPTPISHRRGDPARSEPAGARCPLVAIAASAASLCKARTHSLLVLLSGSTGPATSSLSTATISAQQLRPDQLSPAVSHTAHRRILPLPFSGIIACVHTELSFVTQACTLDNSL